MQQKMRPDLVHLLNLEDHFGVESESWILMWKFLFGS